MPKIKKNRVKIIGITGGLATGTSTVSKYIANLLKANLINADKITHEILTWGNPVYKKIISEFGKGILDKSGKIDKKKLAQKAFLNKKSIKKLCSIVHPAVIFKIEDKINSCRSSFIIVDGPVLIESNFHKRCDKLIVVTSALGAQLARSMNKKDIALADAISRISLQMPLNKKKRYADCIIDNNGDLKELKAKCIKIAKSLKKKRGGE